MLDQIVIFYSIHLKKSPISTEVVKLKYIFILYCMGVGLGGGCQTFYEFGIVSEKIIRNQRKKPDKTYSSLSAFAV